MKELERKYKDLSTRHDRLRLDLDATVKTSHGIAEENTALKERLEIGYAFNADGERVPYDKDHIDGIDCRNASIRFLEEENEQLIAERDKLKAELAELKKANEWQPIEIAPKIEGDSLILWGSFENNLDLGKFCTCGWWQDDDCENGYWVTGGELFTPTHWKPLPQPPETQSRLETIDELARLGQECDRITENQAMTMDDHVAAEAAAFSVGKESKGGNLD